MLRIDARQRPGMLGLCALASCLLVGCGSTEESRALFAARELVTLLGGELNGGAGERVAHRTSQPAKEPLREALSGEAEGAGETIVIEKSEREQTDFDVSGIPDGRELTYATVGNGIAGAPFAHKAASDLIMTGLS